jgi:hypothetical protein
VSDKQIDARLLPIQVGRHTENHPQPSWSLSEIAIRNRSHRRGHAAASTDFSDLKTPSWSPVKMFFGDPDSLA